MSDYIERLQRQRAAQKAWEAEQQLIRVQQEKAAREYEYEKQRRREQVSVVCKESLDRIGVAGMLQRIDREALQKKLFLWYN